MMLRRIGLAAVIGATALQASCVTDSNSIYIIGVSSPSGTNCTFSTSNLLVSSRVDAGVQGDVSLGFVIGNLIQKRSLNISNDPSTVLIEEAEVQLLRSDGVALSVGAVPNPFTVSVSGGAIAGSNDGSSPGTGVVSIPVLPAAAVASLGAAPAGTNILVEVTVRGRTNGNIEVEGGPFTYSITLLPSGSLGVVCTGASTVTCCSPGISQRYCTEPDLAGLCL